MANIGGNNTFDVLVPSWTTIPYAVNGYSYSTTGSLSAQTGSFGIRKDAHLTIQGVTRVDAAGKEQTDGFLAKLELDLWQTDYSSFKNIYMLSKQYVNTAPELASGDWYNFIDNTANPPFGTANGSTALGLEWNYVLSTKDITNKVTLSGKMHPVEYDWQLANATSKVNSNQVSASGSVSGLTTMTYSQAAYGIPGMNSLTVSGDNIGLFSEDTKISFKSVAPSKDTRERPLVKFIEVEIDGKALQGRPWDNQKFAALRNNDFSATAVCWNGVSFVFNNSLSFVGNPDFSDANATVPFKMKGKIAYDPNGVQTNIVFTDGTSTVQFNRSVYQP